MNPRAHSPVYDVYMRSWLWRVRRWAWWRASDRRCEDCGVRLVLHRRDGGDVVTVHHLSYRLPWWPLNDPRSNVRLLCWTCHRKRDAWRYRR